MWIEYFSMAITIAMGVACSIVVIILLQLDKQRKQRPLKNAAYGYSVRAFDSRGWPNELLPRRMRSQNLEPEALAHSQPLLFRQLLGRCKLCESRIRCERDLDRNRTNKMWPVYCPNGPTFNMISALQSSCLSI